MTRMTRPDCAVMCNLINTHTHTHTHTQVSLIPPWEDQREWHRMTRMTRPDCAVMCNLINTRTHTKKKGKEKMPNKWRTIKSLVHKIRLHGRRGKGMAESFSREKLRHAPQKEGG